MSDQNWLLSYWNKVTERWTFLPTVRMDRPYHYILYTNLLYTVINKSRAFFSSQPVSMVSNDWENTLVCNLHTHSQLYSTSLPWMYVYKNSENATRIYLSPLNNQKVVAVHLINSVQKIYVCILLSNLKSDQVVWSKKLMTSDILVQHSAILKLTMNTSKYSKNGNKSIFSRMFWEGFLPYWTDICNNYAH